VPRHGDLKDVDRDALAGLIALEATAWTEMVHRHAEGGGALALHLILPVLQALPIKNRRETAVRLRQLADAPALPWCMPNFGEGESYRR
jgi:hypothetical protein